jgi:uncharacterized protein YggL (DUF469 family)
MYGDLRRKLKKMLFDEWIWFGRQITEHVEYDEGNEEINEHFDYIFEEVIRLLIHNAGEKEIKDYLMSQYLEQRIGSPTSIENIAKKIMAMQQDLSLYARLAKEERDKYPKSELERQERIEMELNEYLQKADESSPCYS